MPRDREVLETLRTIPTPILSDVLEQLGIRGAMNDICPISPELPRMAGYARTVCQGPRPIDADPQQAHIKHVGLVDSDLHPDDVLIIGIWGDTPASSWGALLSLRSRKAGAAGTVVDGSVRDPLEISKLDYPVFRRPTCCPAGSKLRLATLVIDEPVQCGGVQVLPGALVVGDDSGVVVIPAARVYTVIDLAQRQVEKERQLAELIAGGHSFESAYRA